MKLTELEKVREEMKKFVDKFGDLLGRSERRHWCGMYLSGLLLDGERKSIQPIAEKMPGGNTQALLQFVNQSPWAYEPIQERLNAVMAEKFDTKNGVLILDDTSLPKKGSNSVGVAHQYCGALGKVSNCQSIVSWHYANANVHFPVLAELYLPKKWTDDIDRMNRVGVPPRRYEFQKKWELSLDLLQKIKDQNLFSYEAILCDAGYGECREFLDTLNQSGEKFIAQIPESHTFYAKNVKTLSTQKGVGRKRITNAVVDSEKEKPMSAKKWLEKCLKKPSMWKKITIPLQDRKTVVATAVRVHAVDTTSKLYRLDYEGWLIIEKSDDGIRFFIANFPKTKSWKSLVKMTHFRWKIEQGYQRMKEELGLDHFEGRSWLGLHHHITLCFMAYCFLLWIQRRFKKKDPKSHLSRSTTLAKSNFLSNDLSTLRERA